MYRFTCEACHEMTGADAKSREEAKQKINSDGSGWTVYGRGFFFDAYCPRHDLDTTGRDVARIRHTREGM